ncbi:MAG: DUF6360 family protein [Haloarculaceae archaeon]
MVDRILRVNAYTTFDMLDGEIEGHDFEDDAYAVVNVTSPRENPDHVEVQLEMDNVDLSDVPAHADKVTLSAAEARDLAAELRRHAEKVASSATDG